LTESFGFCLESESVAGFGVKSETESLIRIRVRTKSSSQIPEPQIFLKRAAITIAQTKSGKKGELTSKVTLACYPNPVYTNYLVHIGF
jgi:hypothetical protein